MKTSQLLSLLAASAATLTAQTLYVPGGTSTGISNNTANNNVGILTATPEAPLDVNGSIIARGLYSFVAKAPNGYWGFNHENFFAGHAGDVYSRGFSSHALGIFNGSTTAEDVFLFNQNSPNGGVLVLKASGNVGVGTASPSYKLSVEAGSSSNAFRAHAAGDFVFALAGDGVAGANLDLFSIRNNNTAVVHLNTTNGARMALGVSAGASAGSIAENLSILANGNVGIGTTTPASRLHVSGQILFDDATATMRYGVGRFDHNGHAVTGLFADGDYGSSAVSLGFYKNGGSLVDPKLTINPAGNVGIGTTSPTHKLAVNGTIRAHEVIVDSGWSDYVFADDYRLTPLAEVESHIKAERHLPGIPSAQEVAEHGVSMGEMQAKLLAKIEELTLHQIAQEKEISALRAEVSRLSTKN